MATATKGYPTYSGATRPESKDVAESKGFVGFMQNLWIIFVTVFLAELGDKTQLATLLFATEQRQHPVLVFAAAGMALLTATAAAVLVGSAGAHYLTAVPLRLIAGIGFMAIGAWTIYGQFTGA